MPRKRDPKRDEAFELWKQHNGDITNREIAKQLDVPEKTISAWKSRDKWNAVLQKDDCSTTKDDEPKKARAPSKKQKNRSGNHNPKNQFTKRNRAAVKHGLFAKYLPDEVLEIVKDADDVEPEDILLMNIRIQFAQILHAQKVMHVRDHDDMTKELKKEKETENAIEAEYEIQFAWDKQATLLNSVSRAMSELRSMIKQYREIVDEEDDRMLEIERIEASINKTKIETEFIEERTKMLKGTKKDTSLLDALIQVVNEDGD